MSEKIIEENTLESIINKSICSSAIGIPHLTIFIGSKEWFEPLGYEFDKILHDNLDDLLVKT